MSYLYELSTIASNYVPNIQPEWILAQWAHETGGYTSELCIEHRNYAGLTQVEDNGLLQPDGSNYYMSFKSGIDFANYYGKYLSLYSEEGIYEADSVEKFITCLYKGGYFTANYDEYVDGVNEWLAIIL